jgi:hypothetical protein
MRPTARRATPFIVLGIAFLALGMSGRHTFLYVGIAFMIIGIVATRRAR